MNSQITDQQLRNYIDQIFNKYDRDMSGTLQVPEIANFFNDVFAMMGDPRRVSLQEASQALAMIDSNNDGRASKMELFNAFRQVLSRNQGGYSQYGNGQYGQPNTQNYGQGYGQQYNGQQWNSSYNPYNQNQRPMVHQNCSSSYKRW